MVFSVFFTKLLHLSNVSWSLYILWKFLPDCKQVAISLSISYSLLNSPCVDQMTTRYSIVGNKICWLDMNSFKLSSELWTWLSCIGSKIYNYFKSGYIVTPEIYLCSKCSVLIFAVDYTCSMTPSAITTKCWETYYGHKCFWLT